MRSALVVDDDPQVLDALTAMLSALDWNASCTTSGAAALEEVKREPPTIVITDLIMPDMEGIELIGNLHRIAPKLPIVVMSGHPTGSRFLGAARALGAKATLAKPFSIDELAVAIDNATST